MGSLAGLDTTLRDPSAHAATDDALSPAAGERARPGRARTVRSGAPSEGTSRQRCPTCGQEFPRSYRVCPRDATPLGISRAESDPLLGVVLAGTYRLARVLGRGGMGKLYEAEHARLARRFAVKVLHESHADKVEAVRRFEREADALARIRSDFVLDVVDVLRTPDDRTAIVTTLLEGEDLQRRLDRTARVPVGEALAIARQCCRGLAAAHAASVVHRDLKPSNLFLEAASDGRLALKILDFGVAKLAGDDEMTRTGVVLGTPAYMAPEQARGSACADARSDVYAVGAVLYRMLTGRMPYEAQDPGATLARLIAEPPPRPRAIAPDLPVAIEVLIQRAMAREPGERPGSALELEAALASLDLRGHSGEDAPLAIGSASSRREDPDTVVLPHGAVERAESMERDAKRARPLAAMLAIAATLAIGAAIAGGISEAASLLAVGEAQAALARALAIVGGLAGAVASALTIGRWMAPRWSSAPAVQHVSARLGRGVIAGLAAMGVAALAALAAGAIAGEAVPASSASVLSVLVAAGASAWLAARRRP